MTKTLKQEAIEWAEDFWGDRYHEQADVFSRSAGAIGYMSGHDAALAGIEVDQGDLLGCCTDYAELEADGGGNANDTLWELLSHAYYKGAELAVERIKEGRWRK